jgi:hypothetical protein
MKSTATVRFWQAYADLPVHAQSSHENVIKFGGKITSTRHCISKSCRAAEAGFRFVLETIIGPLAS